MGKIDYRLVGLPPAVDTVYVIRNGEFIPANVVNMRQSWSPAIDDEDIVLAVDEDMTPYQLSGSNTVVNVNG